MRSALVRLTIALAAAAIVVTLLVHLPQLRASIAPGERPAAPDFKCDVWLNSPPLSLRDLRGKVVLIDFWEYTCINCIRTFPYLRRWNQLYSPLGLVVIGVHTPEFEFGKNPKVVADAARRFGFTFPIAVDSDSQVWRAFNNDAWPSKYLIDKNGNIALNHVGEGGYAEFERDIQQLLKEANPKLSFADAKFTPPEDTDDAGATCQRPTPETYLGFARAERIANAGGYQPLKEAAYAPPSSIPQDSYALDGRWLVTPEYIRHAATATQPGDSLSLNYRAKSVYLVAGADGAGKPLFVTQDGKPLPQNARGVDVKADSAGRTFIELAGKRMYYVTNNPDFGEHTLKLSAADPGVSLYSFTFGNNCENPFDHR